MKKLFCFGLGYSALTLARRLKGAGWTVAGTCRTAGKQAAMAAEGIEAHLFDGGAPVPDVARALSGSSHILVSIPPGADGDPVLRHHRNDILALARRPSWIGYLSTTGVYGDTGGAEVTEDSPLRPTSPRSEYRVAAERGWIDLNRDHGLPVHVFRLAGIYGPGRSVLDQVRGGVARRIDKPDHRFSRIHVEDIANVLEASIARPSGGAIYNVCDDLAAPQAAVVAYACELLDLPVPPLVPFDTAAETMSAMALTFWRDNRVVSNRLMKEELGVTLRYPTFREGLRAILQAKG